MSTRCQVWLTPEERGALARTPVAYRWYFTRSPDKTWRFSETLPYFDAEAVHCEPLFATDKFPVAQRLEASECGGAAAQDATVAPKEQPVSNRKVVSAGKLTGGPFDSEAERCQAWWESLDERERKMTPAFIAWCAWKAALHAPVSAAPAPDVTSHGPAGSAQGISGSEQ